jgi:hypothetical protein
MIDINAPIIPWEGMAGIKLYSTINQFKDIIMEKSTKALLLDNHWIRYEIENSIYLFFDIINGKLFKITTLSNYKGLLWDSIYVGMPKEEFLKIGSSFVYDDFEEVYVSESQGVFIETDVETNSAQWISVFVKELGTEEFAQSNW